jgi:hypothetical protein
LTPPKKRGILTREVKAVFHPVCVLC